MPVPGRTSRTMPANGDSIGVGDVAGRDTPAAVPREDQLPARARLLRRVEACRPSGCPGAVPPIPTRRSRRDADRAAVRRSVRRRRPNRRPRRADDRRAPVRKTASTGASMSRRAGTSRTSMALIRSSRSRPRSATTRAARRAGRPDRGARGDVAQVDDEPAEPAGDVDREMAAAAPRVGPCRGSGTPPRPTRPAAGRRERARPGIRSSRVEPWLPWTTTEPALRPVCIPAGVTTVPSGASRSSMRSATIARRSSASGIEPSGARIRAWSSANWPAPGRPQDVHEGEGDGRGRCDGPGAAGRDDEVGRRPVGPFRGPLGEPAEGGPGGRHPQRHAVAGRVGPRGDPQLAQAVAQAMPVGAPGRPQADAVDDRIVGIERRQRRGRDDREIEDRRDPADARWRRRARPRVVADLDDVDPPVEDLGEGHRARSRAPAARRRPEGPARRADRPADRRATRAAPPARAGPRRGASTSPKAAAGARPSRRPGRPSAPAGGRPPRRRARPARPARAARRPPADRPPRRGPRRPRHRAGASSSPADRSTPRLPATVRQPLRDAVATSGASARSDAATTARRRGGVARDLEARQLGGAADGRSRAARERRDRPRRRGRRGPRRRPRRRRRPASTASR